MKKRVEDSQTEQTYLMRPIYLNEYGNLFGGQLMEWIDEIASIVAMRHSEADITTACIDNLNFKEGATVNDVIVLRGKITYVGRTSMEVRVDTYVESRHESARLSTVLTWLWSRWMSITIRFRFRV